VSKEHLWTALGRGRLDLDFSGKLLLDLMRTLRDAGLDLDSEETADTLKGDIYAVVDYPFAIVNGAFNDPRQGPANWREVLMLPFAVTEPGVFGVMAPAKGA